MYRILILIYQIWKSWAGTLSRPTRHHDRASLFPWVPHFWKWNPARMPVFMKKNQLPRWSWWPHKSSGHLATRTFCPVHCHHCGASMVAYGWYWISIAGQYCHTMALWHQLLKYVWPLPLSMGYKSFPHYLSCYLPYDLVKKRKATSHFEYT